MCPVFLLTYLVPAAFLALALWLVLIILRRRNVSVEHRRYVFTGLATIVFAPAVVPAGTIMTALVPYGILALMLAPPALHQPRLVSFAMMSFGVTLGIAAIASLYFVKGEKVAPDSARPDSSTRPVVLPAIVMIGRTIRTPTIIVV